MCDETPNLDSVLAVLLSPAKASPAKKCQAPKGVPQNLLTRQQGLDVHHYLLLNARGLRFGVPPPLPHFFLASETGTNFWRSVKSFTCSGMWTFTLSICSYTHTPGSLRAGSRALPPYGTNSQLLLMHLRSLRCELLLHRQPNKGNWPRDKTGTWRRLPAIHTQPATMTFLTLHLFVFSLVFPVLLLSVGWGQLWVWLLLHLRFCRWDFPKKLGSSTKKKKKRKVLKNSHSLILISRLPSGCFYIGWMMHH